jgi:hypothetical protein
MWNASTKYCDEGKLSKILALHYYVVHFLEQKVPRSALTEIEEQNLEDHRIKPPQICRDGRIIGGLRVGFPRAVACS